MLENAKSEQLDKGYEILKLKLRTARLMKASGFLGSISCGVQAVEHGHGRVQDALIAGVALYGALLGVGISETHKAKLELIRIEPNRTNWETNE